MIIFSSSSSARIIDDIDLKGMSEMDEALMELRVAKIDVNLFQDNLNIKIEKVASRMANNNAMPSPPLVSNDTSQQQRQQRRRNQQDMLLEIGIINAQSTPKKMPKPTRNGAPPRLSTMGNGRAVEMPQALFLKSNGGRKRTLFGEGNNNTKSNGHQIVSEAYL